MMFLFLQWGIDDYQTDSKDDNDSADFCEKFDGEYCLNSIHKYYGNKNRVTEVTHLYRQHIMILVMFGFINVNELLFRVQLTSFLMMDGLLLQAGWEMVSILKHEKYEEYKQLAKDEFKKDLMDGHLKHSEHLITKARQYMNSYKNCRSLQELCRVKLYEIVPEGKMSVYVQQFVIPYNLKAYITLNTMYIPNAANLIV